MAASCLQGPFVLQDPSGADGSTEAAAGSSAVGPAAANSQEAAAKFIDIRKKVWQGVFFGFFCNLGTNVLLRSNWQEVRAIRHFQRVTSVYENALVHFSLARRKSVSFFHPVMWPHNRAAPRGSHVVDGRQDEDEAKAKARRRRTNDFEFLDVQTALVRSLQMFFFYC